MNFKGVHITVSSIIILAVVVAVSIATAVWLIGQFSKLMFELNPEIILLSDVLYYNNKTQIFKITIKNNGLLTSIIEYILLDGKYEALIVSAINEKGESRLIQSENKIYIMAGEEVEVWFKLSVDNGQLKRILSPMTFHEIMIKTARGHEYYKAVTIKVKT
ncbi:MAG: hypothetical protein DRJ32_02065 [Thermoprotei archaeon]|nr:MAG: hypothetical protein DRJ32_02065 [Thermoprotei archaeon]